MMDDELASELETIILQHNITEIGERRLMETISGMFDYMSLSKGKMALSFSFGLQIGQLESARLYGAIDDITCGIYKILLGKVYSYLYKGMEYYEQETEE